MLFDSVVDYTRDVHPTVVSYAGRVFRFDPERYSLALTAAWWVWRNRRNDLAAICYAVAGCRKAWGHRTIPGLKNRNGDAYDLRKWDGAGMGQLADRRPGPERIAMGKEALAQLLAVCTEREREVAEAYLADFNKSSMELAAEMGVTPGRVSQLRAALRRKSQ